MCNLYPLLKYCFALVLSINFCLIAINGYGQSTNYGTTVIVHGFQLNGDFPGDFENYARYIRQRVGGNATIYINKGMQVDVTGINVENYRGLYWERIAGNGTGEQIFVYDWANASNNLNTGDLEAAADRLFGMLVKPFAFDENGGPINIGQPLNRPSHFIAHSRGAILCLQVFHRLLQHFPLISINHFTALDPHPATQFGDILSTQRKVLNNLPGVYGTAEDCAIVCSTGKNVSIKVPTNVKYAESIYREDGNYEQNVDFDGVPIDTNNTPLVDSILGGDFINFINSPHSRVHRWYFGTVDLGLILDEAWYEGKHPGPRAKVGFYKSRLGGHINLLAPKTSYNTINQLEAQIKKRQDGKGLSMIFNGGLDHSTVNWGLQENNELRRILANTSKDLLFDLKNCTLKYLSLFYVPVYNKKYLTFKVNGPVNNPGFSLKVQWLGAIGAVVEESKTPIPCSKKEDNQTYQTFKVPIPQSLMGKLASFDVIIETSVNGIIRLDDFDLQDELQNPNSGNFAKQDDCSEESRPAPPTSTPNTGQEKSITPAVINSGDPNDKLGPVGVGPKRYITGVQPLGYQVRFENMPTATAAAQYVKIVDTLDVNVFDLSTFQFGYFNVGTTNFFASPGRKHYLKDWDLRPAKNLIVRMDANFNDTTGVLVATYTALDPATMQLTNDPVLGFLPPNTNAPDGEGSIFFTISPYESLPHETQLSNKAYIYFDNNPVIVTPEWVNTIDKTYPESKVQELPTISANPKLALHWSGSDTGSGPKRYRVYMSVNDKPYKVLISNTLSTSTSFVGKVDSTYQFYCVAVDGVGNQEPIHPTFDTKTTIQGLVVSLSSTAALACSGNSVTLTATTSSSSANGFTYQFTGQGSPTTSNTFVVSVSGDYSVTVTDGTTSSAISASLNITINPTLSVSLSSTPALVCSGSSVTLTATASASTANGLFYQFTGQGTPSPSNIFVATTSGNYSVTVTDGGSCSAVSVSPLSLTVNPALVVSLSSTSAIPCSGASVTLTASTNSSSTSGYTYQFTGQAMASSANTFVASSSGNYSVTLTDGIGCTAVSESPLQISSSNPPNAAFTRLPDHFCVGAIPVTLTPTTPGGVFSLSGVGSIAGNVYTPPASGTGGLVSIAYAVTVNGCSNTSTQSTSVIFQLPPIINLVASGVLGYPTCIVTLSATATGNSFVFTGPVGYAFSNTYRSSGTYMVFALAVKQPGVYTLTAYESGGCQTSSQVQVNGSACPP